MTTLYFTILRMNCQFYIILDLLKMLFADKSSCGGPFLCWISNFQLSIKKLFISTFQSRRLHVSGNCRSVHTELVLVPFKTHMSLDPDYRLILMTKIINLSCRQNHTAKTQSKRNTH